MNVGLTSRIEKEKMYLVHPDPRKNFSRWLVEIIGLQLMWKEISA
jgi:hypothetical protein